MEKTYLIVGGSSSIGSKIIQQLSDRGNRCIILSREDLSATYPDHETHMINITGENISEEMIPDELDGLVYLPGTIQLKPFRAISPEIFREDMEINFMGAVKSIQAAFKSLKKTGNASIVLFSTVAVQTGMPFHASIASAKGAVEGLTRSLAAEFAPGIRVNCIAPSLTDTAMATRLLSSEEKIEAAAKRHPLNSIGAPEDIASMAAFLLGDQARWITGQVIGIDGGIGTLKT